MENYIVRNGLLYGVASILFTFAIWTVDRTMLLSGWISSVGGLLIAIYFVRDSGIRLREEQGGYASFSELMKPTFLTFMIGSFLSAVFGYIMFNYIDSDLLQLTRDYQLETFDATVEKMSELFGEDGEQMEALEEQREKLINEPLEISFIQSIGGWALGLIFGIILSMIISAFIKRSPTV